MDEQEKDKNLELSPEEQKAEEEMTQEVNEDELREKLADDLGIDPEEESELLDKLIAREKSHREKLSGAIKQKRNWREKALKTSERPKENPEGGNTHNSGNLDIDKLVDQKLTERPEARELESLDLPDDLKAEVKELAQLKGISVREAAQHSYIRIRKEEIEREKRIVTATPKRSNKGSYTPSYDPSKPLNPDDFRTPDGNIDVEAWKEAKAARARQAKQ